VSDLESVDYFTDQSLDRARRFPRLSTGRRKTLSTSTIRRSSCAASAQYISSSNPS